MSWTENMATLFEENCTRNKGLKWTQWQTTEKRSWINLLKMFDNRRKKIMCLETRPTWNKSPSRPRPQPFFQLWKKVKLCKFLQRFRREKMLLKSKFFSFNVVFAFQKTVIKVDAYWPLIFCQIVHYSQQRRQTSFKHSDSFTFSHWTNNVTKILSLKCSNSTTMEDIHSIIST